VKSGFFFASKRNEIFASISNFASEAKVRAHPKWLNSSFLFVHSSSSRMFYKISERPLEGREAKVKSSRTRSPRICSASS
jgi:hypothetical protein